MDWAKLPSRVRHDFAEAGYTAEQVASWDLHEVFEKWLRWNSIIGYGDTILRVARELLSQEP